MGAGLRRRRCCGIGSLVRHGLDFGHAEQHGLIGFNDGIANGTGLLDRSRRHVLAALIGSRSVAHRGLARYHGPLELEARFVPCRCACCSSTFGAVERLGTFITVRRLIKLQSVLIRRAIVAKGTVEIREREGDATEFDVAVGIVRYLRALGHGRSGLLGLHGKGELALDARRRETIGRFQHLGAVKLHGH